MACSSCNVAPKSIEFPFRRLVIKLQPGGGSMRQIAALSARLPPKREKTTDERFFGTLAVWRASCNHNLVFKLETGGA